MRQHRRLWIALAAAAAVVGVFVIVVLSAGGDDTDAPGMYGAVPPRASSTPSAADPTGAGVTSIAPGGYRVPASLCRSASFLPLGDLFGATTRSPTGSTVKRVGYTAATCNATLAKRGVPTTADVTAMVFADPAAAAAAQQAAKAQAPGGTEDVDGGFGFVTTGDGYRIYQLWLVDRNVRLGVRLKATPATPPTREQLHTAATGVATATLRKLPHT